MGRMMALRNERMTTAAIPEAKPVISMPGITWLASNTANPVITHRIRNPFMPASYRPCGRSLKPQPPMASETSLERDPVASRFVHSRTGQSSPQGTEKDCGQREKNKATHNAHQHFANPKGHT
jgi:hypothetical protein